MRTERFEKILKETWKEAEKSSCLKKKVGALLVSNFTTEIISLGHGGAAEPCEVCVRKTTTWTQDGCWSVHAEIRALFNFFEEFRFIPDLSDYIMFTTHGPCDQCLKYMNFFKIPLVVYDVPYKTDYSKWSGKITVLGKDEYLTEIRGKYDKLDLP